MTDKTLPPSATNGERNIWARYWTNWYERHIKEAAEAKRFAEEYGAVFPVSETVPIGEVIGHKEFGMALVQWSDNGLRPIGMKVYAAPQASISPVSGGQSSDTDAPASAAPVSATRFNPRDLLIEVLQNARLVDLMAANNLDTRIEEYLKESNGDGK